MSMRSLATGALSLVLALPAAAQEASPHAIDIPAWFEDSFLDLPVDILDAARSGKNPPRRFGAFHDGNDLDTIVGLTQQFFQKCGTHPAQPDDRD